MNLDYPNQEEINSTCDLRLQPRDDDTPTAVAPRCNEETVTWVNKTDGTRLYLCEEHVLDLLRFAGEDESRLRELDYHEELVPLASDRGVNLSDGRDRETLISRMTQRRDPADLPDHPRIRVCPRCRKPTLTDDFSLVEGGCVGCVEGWTELSLDRYR